MKFSSIAVTLSFLYGANAFTPNARLGPSTSTISKVNVFAPIAGRTSSADLSLYMANAVKEGQSVKKVNGSTVSEDSISEKEVRALFELWNSALATGDSRIVASRYAKEGVLLPTVSDQPRTNYESIKDYFDSFLLKKPQGKIIDGNIHIGDGWASDSGIYEFTMGATGDKVKARYTYNYIKGM
mmetsp:Transcript_16231/g.30963  ORF Transcript_16231/g.30963 Transcript_16231/m.30963 type:complete len:184 (-) Transcript_16231:502-1053(-)